VRAYYWHGIDHNHRQRDPLLIHIPSANYWVLLDYAENSAPQCSPTSVRCGNIFACLFPGFRFDHPPSSTTSESFRFTSVHPSSLTRVPPSFASMRFSRSVSAVGFFAALASAAVVLKPRDSSGVTLPIEETVLSEPDVVDYVEHMGFGDDLDEEPVEKRASTGCKYIPGDSQWPSDFDWGILEFFVGDSLIKPDPIGKVCYPGATYDAVRCADVLAKFTNSDLQ